VCHLCVGDMLVGVCGIYSCPSSAVFASLAMADPLAGQGPDRTAPAVTPAVMAGLPSLTLDADDNPRSAYLDSCRDLQSAIGSLESALIAFTGKEEGVKGEVFAKTKARLDRELAQEIAPADS
jgi:hypothetical protein